MPVIDVLSSALYPPRELNGEINREPYLFPQKFHSHLDDGGCRPRRWKASRRVHAGRKARLPGGGLSRPPEPHVIDRAGDSTRKRAAGADRDRGASRPRLPDSDRRRPQEIHRWPTQLSRPHRPATGVRGLVEKLLEKPARPTGLRSDGRAHLAQQRRHLAGDLEI